MNLSDLGRFSDPALLILASLANGPKHGYAMVLDIEQLSGVHLGPGTLYGTLTRLTERGLIEALPAADRRHPYDLTPLGQSALREQLTRLAHFASLGLQRLEAAR